MQLIESLSLGVPHRRLPQPLHLAILVLASLVLAYRRKWERIPLVWALLLGLYLSGLA